MKRRLHFRLRSLFLITLATALAAYCASFVQLRIRQYDQQRAKYDELSSLCNQITPASFVFVEGRPASRLERWRGWIAGEYPTFDVAALGMVCLAARRSDKIVVLLRLRAGPHHENVVRRAGGQENKPLRDN